MSFIVNFNYSISKKLFIKYFNYNIMYILINVCLVKNSLYKNILFKY